jgi:Holliday junction resolvase-like predicted endonuclease
MTDDLLDFLEGLPERDFDKQVEFTQYTVPKFLTSLGYNISNVYYEATSRPIEIHTGPFETSQRAQQADAIVANSPRSRPWLALETLYTHDKEPAEYDLRYTIAQEQSGLYLDAFDCEYYVELSDGHLFVAPKTGEDFFVKLDGITPQESRKVGDLLASPDDLPHQPSVSIADYSEISIDEPFFQLDVGQAVVAFENVQQAEESHEKGDAFEDFAAILFDGIPCLSVRGQNVRTRTGEIDLIIEYLGHSEQTIFDAFDRFALVECKNWTKSVGAREVHVMNGKMQKSQVDLGILFARNGISGQSGTDAVGEINDVFTDDGKTIIVISEDHIDQILRGERFYQILDEKIYQRRFSI